MAGYDDRSYPTTNDDYAMGVPVTLASDGQPNYVPLAEPVVVSGTPLVDSVPMGVAVGGGGGHYARGGTRRQTRKTCWGRVAQIIGVASGAPERRAAAISDAEAGVVTTDCWNTDTCKLLLMITRAPISLLLMINEVLGVILVKAAMLVAGAVALVAQVLATPVYACCCGRDALSEHCDRIGTLSLQRRLLTTSTAAAEASEQLGRFARGEDVPASDVLCTGLSTRADVNEHDFFCVVSQALLVVVPFFSFLWVLFVWAPEQVDEFQAWSREHELLSKGVVFLCAACMISCLCGACCALAG